MVQLRYLLFVKFMQKKNPLYEEVKEDTVWSMDRFNDYVNENFAESKNLAEDWVHTVLRVGRGISSWCVNIRFGMRIYKSLLPKSSGWKTEFLLTLTLLKIYR